MRPSILRTKWRSCLVISVHDGIVRDRCVPREHISLVHSPFLVGCLDHRIGFMKHGACMAKYQIVINLCPNRLIGSAAQIESCCLIADIHDGIIVDLNIILPPMSTQKFRSLFSRQIAKPCSLLLVSTPTNDWIRRLPVRRHVFRHQDESLCP